MKKILNSNLDKYKAEKAEHLYVKIEDINKCRSAVILNYKGKYSSDEFEEETIIVKLYKVFVKNRIDEAFHGYLHVVSLQYEMEFIDEAINLANLYIDQGMSALSEIVYPENPNKTLQGEAQ